MQLVEFVKFEVRNDDGSKLDPETELIVNQLMETFREAKVIGSQTEVGRPAALRMAVAVLNSYQVTPIIKEHE